MRANELRIGNMVYSITHKVNINVSLIEVDTDYSTIEGLPLTEEWLLKVGFRKEGKSFPNYLVLPLYSSSFLLKVNFKTGIVSTGGRGCLADHGRYGHIRAVHQIQNLYFALTGSELTLKDKAE